MQPPVNLTDIPPALVAVNVIDDGFDDERRLLEALVEAGDEAFFKTRDGTFLAKMKVLNALDINVIPIEGDDEEEIASIEYTYDLVDYDGDNLWLQFNFLNPEQVSRSLTD